VKRVPTLYIAILVILAVAAAWALLTYFGVPPFDNLSVFLIFNATAIIALLISGVVGGVFVGMLLAQRILGNREFTPFEKTVLQSLHDVQERLDRLEEKTGQSDEPKLRR